MTDRINGLYVVLEKDVREDDIDCIITAIKMIKNVISVKPHVKDFSDDISLEKARHELSMKIYKALE